MQAPSLQLEDEARGRDAALVVVAGYLTEDRGPDPGWPEALRACGWDGAIYSLRWDTSSYRRLVTILLSGGGLLGARLHWWRIKHRARRTARDHVGPLLRRELPFDRISLIGHSLGARLAYFALTEGRPRPLVDDLILAGGALRRDSSKAWRRFCGTVGGRVLNLRNSEDFVLRNVFRAAERWQSPCGLKPVKHPGPNLIEIDATEAMREAGQAGRMESHTGYLHAFPALIRFVEGRAEPKG